MKVFDEKFLDELSESARNNARLRMNYNLHRHLDAKAQRLFNALELGTDLPIHRHKETDETYILIRGKLRIDMYNEKKEFLYSETLSVEEKKFGAHIEAGEWHTIEILEKDTIIFEVKDGPYKPFEPDDILT